MPDLKGVDEFSVTEKNARRAKLKNEQKESKLKKFFQLKTISSKILLTCFIDCIVLVVFIILIFSTTIYDFAESSMKEKLSSDTIHLEDIIGHCEEGEWRIEDGALYRGDVLIGDATEENANLEPFLETEAKTGTFCYTFMKCSDEGLTWTGDEKTGYMQGHFIRVAGSTKDPNGNSIVGTYMDKKVADVLDEAEYYSGEANVAGGKIFCQYDVLKNYDGEVVGAIVVGRSMNELNAIAQNAGRNITIFIILIIVLAGAALLVIALRWTKSVGIIAGYLERIGSGELPDDPLKLKTRDEIADVAVSVNEMVEGLKDRERIGAELSVATDIQANLLPKIFPAFPERKDFDLYASMNPAKEVGGDFYDFFMLDERHIALIIADVSGKGVPAALFMVTAKTLVKDHAQVGQTASEVFTTSNKLLCEGNDAGLFITSWMGIVDLATGEIDVANAGHNPPLICHDGKFEYLKQKPGFVLAGMEGIKYKSQTAKLEEGDILFLYTDGVTEATNINNELYGEQRLVDKLNENAGVEVNELVNIIKQDVMDFTGEAPQFDDVTMLCFKYIGGKVDLNIMEVDAVIENIPQITDFVDRRLEQMDVPVKTKFQIDVAIDEIVSNIAFYAYNGHVGYVRVEVEEASETGQVRIKFTDGGMPYNPLEREAPDITASAEERGIGGLGIHIVRKTMDDVRYEYENGKNILTIVKNI